MADVTADAFSKVSNADKLFQANSFKNIWQLNVQSGDFKCEKGLVGFDCLIKMLKEQASSYQKNGKSISAAHTQRFINNVEEVIQKAKKLASLDGTDAIIR